MLTGIMLRLLQVRIYSYEVIYHIYNSFTVLFYLENRTQLRLQLKVSLETTAIGEILIAFNEHCEDLYCRYLHDFVRIIHQCHYKDEISADIEYKVSSIRNVRLISKNL